MEDREYIEMIASGDKTKGDIEKRLESYTNEARIDFCMKLYGRTPMGGIPTEEEYRAGHCYSGLTIQQEKEAKNLEDALFFVESRFGIDIFGEVEETAQFRYSNTESLQTEIVLLPELDTELARKIFCKCIEKGWIARTNDKLKWLDIYENQTHGRKARLAYLLDKIYSEGEFPETKLNGLFGEKRLGSARSKLFDNKGSKPKMGAEEIDRLFTE